MSRFGLLSKRCARKDKRTLTKIDSVRINDFTFNVYKSKNNLYMWCLENAKWYKLSYRQFIE